MRGGRCTPPLADPRADTPPGLTPPWADTTQQTSCGQTPPSRHQQTPPPRDGHCSGWYASYWNAFLFCQFPLKTAWKLKIIEPMVAKGLRDPWPSLKSANGDHRESYVCGESSNDVRSHESWQGRCCVWDPKQKSANGGAMSTWFTMQPEYWKPLRFQKWIFKN